MTGKALCVISLLLVAVLLAAGFRHNEEWSFQQFIGIESYLFKATFFVWNPSNWKNKTDDLWEDSFDQSPLSVTAGMLGAIVNCYGWLQQQVLIDIALLLSFDMTQHMSRLIGLVKDENASLDMKWTEYEELKKSSNKINDTFQHFLSLAHVNNLLLFSYFLLRVYYRKSSSVYILLHGVRVAKIILTYCINSSTAQKVIVTPV